MCSLSPYLLYLELYKKPPRRGAFYILTIAYGNARNVKN